MTEKGIISNRQLQTLIIINVLGFLSMNLPGGVSEINGESGWLYVLIGGVIVSVISFLSLNNNELYLFLEEKTLGRILSLLFSIKIILCSGLWLRVFSEALIAILSNKTSSFVFSSLLIILAIYASSRGINTISRFSEIAFGFCFLVLIFIFSLSVENVEFKNLVTLNFNNSINGVLYVISSVFGIEYLIFVGKHTNNHSDKKEIGKSAVHAGLLVSLFLSGITAFTVGIFGVEGVIKRRWATLHIMDTINFPLMFLERQDLLMIGFMAVSLFTFICSGVFFGREALKNVVKKESIFIDAVVGILILIVSIIPTGVVWATSAIELAKILNIAVIVFILIGTLVKAVTK